MLKFRQLLDTVSDILIVPHVSPDGDALGSCAALKMYLEKIGKKADLFVSEEVPCKFDCVSEYYEVKAETDHVYELVIYVDCAEKTRADVKFPAPKKSCMIDHHITNPKDADVNIVDGYAPAAGEIIYELFEKTGVYVDEKIAAAIYLAILTDTGGFIFESTRKRTLEIIAKLYDYEFDRTDIVTKSMLKKSVSYNKLYAYVIDNVVILENIAAVCYIDNDYYTKNNVSVTDTDGLSNVLKNIEGLKCGITLTEREKGLIKGSIRTDAPVSAVKIASLFGGGGHIRAAGFSTDLKYEEIRKKINEWLLTCE